MPQVAKRIQLRRPHRARAGARIELWKYEAVKRAILHVVPRKAPGLPVAGLAAGVSRELTRSERLKMGSIGWYTVSVKLDLEACGFLGRVPGVAPRRLIPIK